MTVSAKRRTRYNALRKECAARGLKAQGTVAVLEARLTTALAASGASSTASAASVPHAVLPPRFARRLFYSSSVTAVSVVASAWYARWCSCALATAVLLCSWNYWRHPTRCWRRNIDMVCAFAGIAYHAHVAVSHAFARPMAFVGYAVLSISGIGCYLCARAVDDVDRSSAWHARSHFVGNAAAVWLFYALS